MIALGIVTYMIQARYRHLWPFEAVLPQPARNKNKPVSEISPLEEVSNSRVPHPFTFFVKGAGLDEPKIEKMFVLRQLLLLRRIFFDRLLHHVVELCLRSCWGRSFPRWRSRARPARASSDPGNR